MTALDELELTVRPCAAEDRALLQEVYAASRAEELAQVAWAPGQRQAFEAMQFSLQDAVYRRHHPDGDFLVVEVAGTAAGRLYVARCAGEVRLVDIALLPAYRGRGIGTALVTGLQREAAAAGQVVVLHVRADSPARALYERLGFRVVGDLGVDLRLEWAAEGSS
jgi:ribosomal protein S18 acetylase RimI-like enzyme